MARAWDRTQNLTNRPIWESLVSRYHILHISTNSKSILCRILHVYLKFDIVCESSSQNGIDYCVCAFAC